MSTWGSVAGAIALVAVLTACGAGVESTGRASTSAAPATPPPEVSEAFCDLLDAVILDGLERLRGDAA